MSDTVAFAHILHIVYSMQVSELIPRVSLSDSAAARIRAMIVDGRLAAGERINEVRMAARLGVSRTPLREALNRLAAEEAIEARPHQGYFVKPLTLEEFEQIYDIRPILDPAALRLAGAPSAEQLDRLAALNRRFAAARDPEVVITLDDEWHLELLAGCPNRVLVEIISNIIRRTRRYELALMREAQSVAKSSEDHEAILSSLRAGDLEGACALLEHNMRQGRAAIVAWLRQRGDGQITAGAA